jgi:hypothetical protein
MGPLLSILFLVGFAAFFIYLMYLAVQSLIENRVLSGGDGGETTRVPYNDAATVSQAAELQRIRLGNGVGIRNLDAKLTSACLRDVVVKGSYNSAYTGSYMNLDMITYVLSRGCRFLDFQVFVKDGVPIVGYSQALLDPSFTSLTSLDPPLSLKGVCDTIMAGAFSDTSPNAGDPLFVQFHIKTNQPSGMDAIANVLHTGLKNKLLWNASTNAAVEVTPNTRLCDLVGKLVLVVAASHTKEDQITLDQVTNMKSGTPNVPIYTESELVSQMYNPAATTSYLLRIVTPTLGYFSGVNNVDSANALEHYSSQVILEAFYSNDAHLTAYESMFSSSAFLLLSAAINYIQSKKSI